VRAFSSAAHRDVIGDRDLDGVLVDDAVLPAAAHLTGPHARRVLRAAVEAAGGTLGHARACHLHYRPGYDVVVRFDSRVRWNGSPPVEETLVAATTVSGPPPGTLPVEAVTPDGDTLVVGVWRWPFDPVLTGLESAVTPATVAEFLDGLSSRHPHLEVVTYRPTHRAVVRVSDDAGAVFYLKALRPGDVADVVERHRALLAGGVPVPPILRHDAARGLIAMGALSGPTIRDRIRRGDRQLPAAAQYEALFAALSRVTLKGAEAVEGRAGTALRHAAMLETVLPAERARLRTLGGLLAPAVERAAARSGPTIHGDLYEAQLVTGRGRGRADTICGVLDLDDAGPGDPLDDRATVIAHLLSRAVDSRGEARRRALSYAAALRRDFAGTLDQAARADLDLVTAGALVGLATGPFRTQQRTWQPAVRRRLTMAHGIAAEPGEKTLRVSS
jgi:hypothetical protein